MRRSAALALVLSAAALVACASRSNPVDPACSRLVDKIIECDPSARGAPRSVLERSCSPSRYHCGELPTGTPAACARFVGCLYDG